MNVINMLTDYFELCKKAEEIGNCEAYKNYTEKYPQLFNNFFNYLYMKNIDDLKQMIEKKDFNHYLSIAEKNDKDGLIKVIEETALKTAADMQFSTDFDLYIGLELGNIGGSSIPVEQGNPFVYFGIDRILNVSDIKITVQHELNHMIRGYILRGGNPYDFTERVITEGLGTYCPVALAKGKNINEIKAESLGISANELKNLYDNRDAIEKNVENEFGTNLTIEKMEKYFMSGSVSGNPFNYTQNGYFIGMCIIEDLINDGFTIYDLTAMPSQEIYKAYKQLAS